jgi:GH15 family glucan-1,4-alpha-glucosidase
MGTKNVSVDTAYRAAKDILQRCASPLGLKASGSCCDTAPNGTPHTTGYPQVWARDAVICLPGALLSKTPELLEAARNSLKTLLDYQSERGKIPLNVDVGSKTISHENSGSVDANTLLIIGVYWYTKFTQDFSLIDEYLERIKRAYLWLEYQDSNECGLLEVHEGANWADLYPTSYNTLFDNVLWYLATRAMGELTGEQNVYKIKAEEIKQKMNFLFWVDRGWDENEIAKREKIAKEMHLEWFNTLGEIDCAIEMPFYLSHVMFRSFGHRFDSFGNFLAILSGIADKHQSDKIFNYVDGSGINAPYPVKAFYPCIYPGDPDWREYLKSRNLNIPHHYHNGGIWPMLGGWYVVALVRSGNLDQARHHLQKLAESIMQCKSTGSKTCNEYLHGESGKPLGNESQGFTAAMYIFAYEAVKNPGIVDMFF